MEMLSDFQLDSRDSDANITRDKNIFDGVRGTFVGEDAEEFCRRYGMRLSLTLQVPPHDLAHAYRVATALSTYPLEDTTTHSVRCVT